MHTYNQRLFSTGLRKYFHEARFFWLREQVQQFAREAQSVLEIGCYDAKTISYLPNMPSRYLGLDADWENGLKIARQAWSNYPNYEFVKCIHPSELLLDETLFDISICMETLEHLPNDTLHAYLKFLGEKTKGYCFITVPNEKGIFLLGKYLYKRLIKSPSERYTFAELMWAVFGRIDLVKRDEHKGFDYHYLIKAVERAFSVVKVRGIPFPFLPLSLNFSVGIVAKNNDDKSGS